MWVPKAQDQVPQKSCLHRLQRDLGLGHLPRFFGTATTCLLSPHSQVVTAATQSLQVAQPRLWGGSREYRGFYWLPCLFWSSP